MSLGKLLKESVLHQEESLMRGYLQVVLAANVKTLREVRAMEDMTMDEFLEEAGYIAKWTAQGRAQGVKEALELLQSGKTPGEILQMYYVPEPQPLNDQAVL